MTIEDDLGRSDWEGMTPQNGLTGFLIKVILEFESTKDPHVIELSDAAKNLLEDMSPEEKKGLISMTGEFNEKDMQSFLETRLKEILSEEEWKKIDDEERRRHLADDSYKAGVAG